MPHEKHYTAKQVTIAVLDKVGQLLKKSEALKADLHKSYEGFKAVEESARKGGASDPAAVAAAAGRKKYGKEAFQHAAAEGKKMGKAEEHEELKCEKCEAVYKSEQGSDGHYSMNADPGEPKAGKASKPGKCPECGHPSPKTGEGTTLPRSKAQEDWMEKTELTKDFENLKELIKYEPENSKKMGYKLSSEGKEERQPEASDHAFDVKSRKESSSPDPRLAQQKDPMHNAKEQAEGNNELAGTTPTQVGQDGKNMPGGDEIKGHLKLAKFVGRMDYKRQNKQNQQKVVSQEHVENPQSSAEAQHKESIRNK